MFPIFGTFKNFFLKFPRTPVKKNYSSLFLTHFFSFGFYVLFRGDIRSSFLQISQMGAFFWLFPQIKSVIFLINLILFWCIWTYGNFNILFLTKIKGWGETWLNFFSRLEKFFQNFYLNFFLSGKIFFGKVLFFFDFCK